MRKLVLLFMFIFAAVISIAQPTSAAAVYDHNVILDMNGGDYTHQDIAALGSKMKADTPINILTIGDSTSDQETEWLYLFGEELGLEIPDYTIDYQLWNNSNLSYDSNTIIQYGTEGDAYASYNNDNDKYISAMDSTEFSITGDLDLRAKVHFDDGESGVVVSKWETGTQASYFMTYGVTADGTSGVVSLYWSEDGSTAKSATSSGFAIDNTEPLWIQATLDVDDAVAGYEVQFNYSDDDGVTWTAINTVTTVAGSTSIFDSGSIVEVGRRSSSVDLFVGDIYKVEIRNGIDGTLVGALDFDSVLTTDESIKDIQGNTWVINDNLSIGNGSPSLTLLNGSIAGAKSATFNANVLDGLVNIDIDAVFINLGHNEDTNDIYVSQLEDFIDAIQIYTGDVPIVLITQNPQTTPRTSAQILAQDIRMDQLRLVAARNDYVLIDSGAALATDTTTYVYTDGVHPTTAGYEVWGNQVFDAINTGLNSGVSEIELTVEDGELIIEPNIPVKDGATFLGWFTNEGLTDEWDFDVDTVEDDMTLYAKWTTSTTSTGWTLTTPGETIILLGLAWYWWLTIAAVVYYFGFNKKGKKTLKKFIK